MRGSEDPDGVGRGPAAALATAEAVLAQSRRAGKACSEEIAQALSDKGDALVALERRDEAITVFDELVTRFVDAADPGVRRLVAWGLRAMAQALCELGRPTDELAALRQLVNRFRPANDPVLRQCIQIAIANIAATLRLLGRREEALAEYFELNAEFRDDAASDLRGEAAEALLHAAITAGELGRADERIRIYDQLLAQFDDTDAELRPHIAEALIGKALAWRGLGDDQASSGVFDELADRFYAADSARLAELAEALVSERFRLDAGTGADISLVCGELKARVPEGAGPDLHERLAAELNDTGFYFHVGGDFSTAITAYDEVLERFSDVPEPAVAQHVARAHTAKRNAIESLSSNRRTVIP